MQPIHNNPTILLAIELSANLSVRPEGAYHQWRRNPPRKLAALRAQQGSTGYPGWQLRADTADQCRRRQSQDTEVAARGHAGEPEHGVEPQ